MWPDYGVIRSTWPNYDWLTAWLTNWLTDWLTHQSTNLLTHSFTHSLTHSFIHSLTHSCTHSHTHSHTDMCSHGEQACRDYRQLSNMYRHVYIGRSWGWRGRHDPALHIWQAAWCHWQDPKSADPLTAWQLLGISPAVAWNNIILYKHWFIFYLFLFVALNMCGLRNSYITMNALLSH